MTKELAIAPDRMAQGRHAQKVILIGLRGVCTAVLLNKLFRSAERERILAVPIKALNGQSLQPAIVPAMRTALRLGPAPYIASLQT
jgi:hypothetical protein